MAYLSNTVATEVYMAQERIHHFAKQIARIKWAEYRGIELAPDLKSLDFYEGLMAGAQTMIECLLMAHGCYNGFQVGRYVGQDSFYCDYHAYDLRKAIRPKHLMMLIGEEAA